MPSSPKYVVKSINVAKVRQSLKQDSHLLHLKRGDLYHLLLKMKWWPFLGVLALVYIGMNIFFACLYLLTGDGIANARPGSFVDAFFFSIQTLSTVGYGSMYPKSLPAQIITSIEIFIGVLGLSVLTGLMFAHFSRPTARVMFSKVAVVCPYNGVPTLMFRAANRRENQILEAQVRVSFLRNETSAEGQQMRRFYDLKLVRQNTPVFALTWLVMHPIDEDSPLHGLAPEDLIARDVELWVTLTGLDETFSQTIHSRYAYDLDDIVWNARFLDVFTDKANGERFLDLRRFHDVTDI
ncbi:MAG: Inward rectifier potassium channel Kirbac3.1 [Chroococcopsis gigantea SAG 12.99]|jgi:inward rectifier potassium channel|nr:ion transporter [Chlorogloea purpurea SAG 13.99]MDV2999672.1 Inward rectifier potassium channel Kirbac3.1 [Chroococcopsis gigantea SAG 12.99]